MKRRLSNFVAYLSLIVCAALAVLWAVSYLRTVHASGEVTETDLNLSVESGWAMAWAQPSFGSAAFMRSITLYEDGTPSMREEWNGQLPALGSLKLNSITGGGWSGALGFPLWLPTVALLLLGGLALRRRAGRRGFEITQPPHNPPMQRTATASSGAVE
jgi:TRAP-type C4-dicarboxylate transport system permease small subunit